jgi:hypothetical protein
MTRTLIILCLAAVAAFVLVPTARAASYKTLVYHKSAGHPVIGLQWELGGHAPSAYKWLKPFKGKRTGFYGDVTRHAVHRAKYRLGWRNTSGKIVGPLFQKILRGELKRPPNFILRAGKRAKAARNAGKTQLYVKLNYVESSQVGVHEVPWGSNASPYCGHPGPKIPAKACVNAYQSATGAYGAAWCASYFMWVLDRVGIHDYGYRSAYVPTVFQWARDRGLIHAIPRAGDGVIYFFEGPNASASHIGFVQAVSSAGNFITVEGNHSDAVSRVYRSTAGYGPFFLTIRR